MALEAVQAQAGHRSIESTRVYLHLANDWLAEQYRRAAELIDADQDAVAAVLAVQEVTASWARCPPGSWRQARRGAGPLLRPGGGSSRLPPPRRRGRAHRAWRSAARSQRR